MRFIETIIDYLRGTNLKRYQAKRGHQTKKWAIKPKEGITPKKWAIKPKSGQLSQKISIKLKKGSARQMSWMSIKTLQNFMIQKLPQTGNSTGKGRENTFTLISSNKLHL